MMMPASKIAAASDRTEEHYADLLAPIYQWMLGDFASALERAGAELRELGVGAARPGARALDLGAGSGLYTVPLCKLGYEVTAVDQSELLLSELERHCPPARVVRADLRRPGIRYEGCYDVIVCMGDTLTHLGSGEQIRTLLRETSARLAPGGLIVLTFRDYTGPPPEGSNRFILVRSDAERILTCRLEYRKARVSVTDIVHELQSGNWSVRASEYEKLRLAPSFVAFELAQCGLWLEKSSIAGGRVSIVARRGAGTARSAC